MKTSKQTSDSAPVAKIRIGNITASIFANSNDNGTFYSANITRGWRDAENKWHSSTSLGLDELLVAAKVADMAHSKILELQARP